MHKSKGILHINPEIKIFVVKNQTLHGRSSEVLYISIPIKCRFHLIQSRVYRYKSKLIASKLNARLHLPNSALIIVRNCLVLLRLWSSCKVFLSKLWSNMHSAL